MLSKTSLRIAGAAMLGTAALLGTNAANAQIDLDEDTGGATYARETVETTGSLEVDDAKYYLLGQDSGDAHAHKFQAMVGVGAGAGDRTLIEYELSGAVFAEELTNASLTVATVSPVANIRLIGDGEEKGSTALFSVTDDFDKTALATLTARLAIGTGGSASIIMRARNVDLGQVLGMDSPSVMNDESYSGAVKLTSALKESAEATNVTTTVTSGFQKFEGATEPTTVSLGSFMIASTAKADQISKANAANVSVYVTQLSDIVQNSKDAEMSYVVFSGDFSFASNVGIFEEDTCKTASTGSDLRMMEGEGDDEVILDTTTPVMVSAFDSARFLCITVTQPTEEDAEAITIPETAPYTVTATYEDLARVVFGTEGETHNLGRIMRDGTTVRLPYLTTNDRFNQRIYIVNRGAAVDYVMTFHGDGDEAGMDAEGELMGSGATTILSLRDNDVVTIGPGRTSTSGTIIIEAESNMIDVATSQINRELGTSDTVVYQED